jgi:AcrR family transcriptional regulator
LGKKLGLTLDDVVASAASIADRDGVDALTLARVADALDLKSPSLYNHVDGLAGLRRALALHASEELARSLSDAVGTDEEIEARPLAAIRRLGVGYRSFATQHPGLYASLLPAPSPEADPELAQAMYASVDVVASAFRSAGVEPAGMIPTIRAFRSMVHGFVDLENSGGFGLPDDIDESFDIAVDMVIAALGQ